MNKALRSVIPGVLMALQVLGTLYVAFACWLMARWMADDSWAFHAASIDWWREAGVRFGQGALVGAAVALALWLINVLLVRVNLAVPRIGPKRVAAGALGVIAVASAVGAIQFAVERPYM